MTCTRKLKLCRSVCGDTRLEIPAAFAAACMARLIWRSVNVERCEDCAHMRVAYNSCLMGKIRNGESTGVDIGSDAV